MRSPPKCGEGPGYHPRPTANEKISAPQHRQQGQSNPPRNVGTEPPLAPPVTFSPCETDVVSVQVGPVHNTPHTPRVGAGEPMLDKSPTRIEMLAEVHRIVHQVVGLARSERGGVPAVGTQPWWGASPISQIAGLLVLAEAWLITDPDRIAREQLKAMSSDLAGARNWAKAARRPSHRELLRRRGEFP